MSNFNIKLLIINVLIFDMIGVAIAANMSYLENDSLLLASLHGILGWLYVGFQLLTGGF